MHKVRMLAAYWPITILTLLALLIQFDYHLLHLTGYLPGTADQAAMALWHTWWPQYGIRAPEGLAIHAYGGGPYLANHLAYMPILQSWIYRVFQVANNPVLSVNLILILSQVITQLIIYGYMISRNVPRLLASLGSTFFVLSAWYSGVIARADVIEASVWTLPLTLLLWDKWLVHRTPLRIALVVGSLYLALLSGLQNISWIVCVYLPYALWTIRTLRKKVLEGTEQWIKLRQQLSVAGLGLILILLIYPLPVMVRTLLGDEPAMGPVAIGASVHSIIGVIRISDVVIIAFSLATAFLVPPSRKAYRWLFLALLLFLLGTGIVPDPLRASALALELPFQAFYEPRILLGTAIFVSVVYILLTWSTFWAARLEESRLRWPTAAAALVSFLLMELLISDPSSIQPLNNVSIPTYSFYSAVGNEPEDYYLLTYPNGLLSTQTGARVGDAAYLFQYAVWHHKRALGGVAPYYDPIIASKLSHMDFLYLENGVPVNVASAATEMGIAIREWRIGYVVIHSDLLPLETIQGIEEMAMRTGALCPPIARDGLIIYRALWHPYACPGE